MDGTLPISLLAAARRCAGPALILLALLAGAVPAHAQVAIPGPVWPADPALTWPVGGPAVEAAIGVAHAHWAGTPCRGRATIRWADLRTTLNAHASWSNLQGQWDRPQFNVACEVVLNRRVDWDWPKLCTVIVHEVGHLMGHDHVADRDDVMNAFYVRPVVDCAAEPVPPTGPGHPPGHPAAGTGGTAATTRATIPKRTVKRRVAKPHRKRTGRS